MLLSKLTAPLPSACDPAALNALLVEFSRQGNNLNQIAHHCNEHRVAPSQKVLADMAAMLRAAVEKVLAL